jgi:HEAT repeat protein
VSTEAVPVLIQLLDSPDPLLREHAAFILGEFRSPAAVQPLLPLLSDTSRAVHIAAFNALGKIGEAALDALGGALHDPRPGVRIGLAYALGIMGAGPSPAPHRALAGVPPAVPPGDPEGVPAAARGDGGSDSDRDDGDADHSEPPALSDEGRGRVVSLLLGLLEDHDEPVRAAASSALGMMGESSADPLIRKLTSPDPVARREAFLAIGNDPAGHTMPAAIAPLIAALSDPDPEIRYLAAKGLRPAPDPRTVEPLMACLQDPSPEVRKEAAEGLRRRTDPRIPAILVAALRDDAAPVRWTAACALGELGDPRAGPALVQALQDEDESVRDMAARSLGMLKPDPGPEIRALLTSDDPKLRCGAVTILGAGKDPESVVVITRALRDRDAGVRRKAAEALCRFSGPAAVPPLLDALRDPDDPVRKYALRALSKTGDPRILDPTIAALKDPDAGVRAEAAWCLQEIGDPRAVPFLREALEDRVAGVRHQAALSLETLGGGGTGTPLPEPGQATHDLRPPAAVPAGPDPVHATTVGGGETRVRIVRKAAPARVVIRRRRTGREGGARPSPAAGAEQTDTADEPGAFADCLPLHKKDPRLAREWLDLVGAAGACTDRGDLEGAKALLDRAGDLFADSEVLITLRGFVLSGLGRYEEALDICQKGIRLNPRHAGFWSDQGALLANLEHYDEALKSFKMALSLGSPDEELWYKTGIVLNNLGRYGEAVRCFDHALRINPGYQDAQEARETALGNALNQ